MSVDLSKVLTSLQAVIPASGVRVLKNPGPSAQDALLVDREHLLAACRIIRDGLGYDFLSNVTGVDWPDAALAAKVAPFESSDETPTASTEGFLEVVYHLYSTAQRIGPLVLKCRTANRSSDATVPSVVSVYRSAEFQEREAFDLYGIIFTNHPDLRRILMWDEFEDYPMRKDYVAPDDYEYEPTPHDAVLEKAKAHYPSSQQ